MPCIYLKQKLNRKFECKKYKKEITFSRCRECDSKEYKCTINKKNCVNQEKKALKNAIKDNTLYKSVKNNVKKSTKVWKKSVEISKLERNRKSLFTDNLDYCILCGKPKEHLHEVCFGRNRINSMKYGLVVPVCHTCHGLMHNNIELQTLYHKKGQALFEEAYPKLDFIEIFGRNYKN